MTDREMLELAAKVAGIGPLDFDYANREKHGLYFGPRLPMQEGKLMAAIWTYWNPLNDDGDALWLAVKLRLDIAFSRLIHDMHTKDQVSVWIGDDTRFDELMHDEMKATRRAIVRAAAEIGRNMP